MATYCVVFRAPSVSRAIRFYLKAASADRALMLATQENPNLRALGVELADRTLLTQNRHHAA